MKGTICIFFARRDERKLAYRAAKFQEEPYGITMRNRLEKLWYMTNIPVLER